MDRQIREVLNHCSRAGLSRIVLGVPFPLDHVNVSALKETDIVSGMVLYHPPPQVTATSSHEWLGCFTEDGDWLLPTAKGTLVFVGPHLMITRHMALRVMRSRRFVIVCNFNGTYRALNVYRFMVWLIGDWLHHKISRMPPRSVFKEYLFRLAGQPVVRDLWACIFKREGLARGLTLSGSSGRTGESLYLELFRSAAARPKCEKIHPVPGRVLLVNAGLAAGGAERQIVNTLIGLRDSGQCESVTLLAEYIGHAPNLDFFLPELQSQGIVVTQIPRTVSLARDGLSSLPSSIATLVADLPGALVEEILNLVEEFQVRRPSVVHAWQDSTSIKAGVAAVIAGVPRIVLASRNVTPVNFAYYQEYMQTAYRALATLECVTFLNNSEAGAEDYTRWLSLAPERFAVVRNGVDLTNVVRPERSEIEIYRNALGIPDGALVVGSIFRFWAEKRPMLWLESADEIARARPDVHFLIIGEGPMRAEMEAFIHSRGRDANFHLPGARPAVALPLSAMDMFLLTSAFEGTPNVILEAQWLGLPVVATDAGGTRESFAQGISGELAELPDARDIARLVLRYLNNPEDRACAAEHAPAFVRGTFGLRRMVRETLALYGMSDISQSEGLEAESVGDYE